MFAKIIENNELFSKREQQNLRRDLAKIKKNLNLR
jgi:hypothetical protein